MSIVESSPKRLVLQSGSTTLSLDRESGEMTLQQKILFWKPKPAKAKIADVTEVKLDTVVDRASGAELHHTMMVMKGDQGWAFPARDKAEAEANSAKLRQFVGLTK
jgi:hypothetical protein